MEITNERQSTQYGLKKSSRKFVLIRAGKQIKSFIGRIKYTNNLPRQKKKTLSGGVNQNFSSFQLPKNSRNP